MTGPCCSRARGFSGGPARRWLSGGGSAIPGLIALLLPKCPLCLMAWIAASTGVAVPAIVANAIRPVLGIVCALLLIGFVLTRRLKPRAAIPVRRSRSLLAAISPRRLPELTFERPVERSFGFVSDVDSYLRHASGRLVE